jgi:hypothetical protein
MTIPDAAGMLRFIRDNPGRSFEQLCEHFGSPALSAEPAFAYYVRSPIESLQEIGLVEQVAGDGYQVTENYTNLRRVFPRLSLRVLADQRRAMQVYPFYGWEETTARIDVFVIMPFKEEFKNLYTKHLKPLCKTLHLEVKRADDFFHAQDIVRQVWSNICAARLLIADISERNANVFYELGLAHAIGKPAILITRDTEQPPFDVGNLRYIRYEYTPEGIIELKQQLRKAIPVNLSEDS